MKSTIVPAQITTVEDRIAGNLGLSQVLLLISPVFGGSVLYVILPPFFGYAEYKVGVIVLLALLCGILAVRIKGKILLLWAIVRVKYNLRPAIYVFNKNCENLRQVDQKDTTEEIQAEETSTKSEYSRSAGIAVPDQLKVDELVADPQANVHFTTTKKGELRVLITEIPHESLGSPAN